MKLGGALFGCGMISEFHRRGWKPVLYVENDRMDRAQELVETIYSLDYRAYWHLAPLYSARNFLAAPLNPQLAGYCSPMLYCVPSDGSRPVPGAFTQECSPDRVLAAMTAFGMTDGHPSSS